MSDDSERNDHAYGTALRDAPVSRRDFERAIRSLNMSDLDLRDAMLNLAARMIALTDELTRRLDGVEPLPAPPNTPAPTPTATVEAAVEGALDTTLIAVRTSDVGQPTRVSLELGGPKYEQASPPVPCDELMPICQARCCTFSFPLSTEDLDEGVIRWDYGQPYLIRQRASDGYCVHNHPDTRACTVHQVRPRVCRWYDCRKDPRIWSDFEKRIPAPPFRGTYDDRGGGNAFDLFERAKARAAAIKREATTISETFAEGEPRKGPKPQLR